VTLSNPLEDLVSPQKALILTVLERAGQPLTGRTIAALTGSVSQSTTSRLLIELGQHGLVVKVPGGYALNRDHLSYRAIDALLGARDELQRRVAEDVNAWDSPPVSVILFGSAARRQDTPGSDIDLLVVRPTTVSFDDQRWAMNVANLSERVSRWCGSPCEVLEYAPDELDELTRTDDPLIASLIRDGITFVGADIEALLHPVTR